MKMKLTAVAAILAASVALAGCNTMAGLGHDLKKGAEHAGAAISKGAEHAGQAIGKAGDKLTQAAESGDEEK